MPAPGHRWYHLILTTRGAWLPGDPRGFRNREHRVHSSGDYKHRPPADEHAGLYAYQVRHARDAVVLPPPLQAIVGCRIVGKAREQQHRLLALAVARTHVHALVELPDDYDGANKVAASWKQASSHAVRTALPGRVWGRGGKPIEVDTLAHQQQVFGYIVDHAGKEGAWVWTYRDGEPPSGASAAAPPQPSA